MNLLCISHSLDIIGFEMLGQLAQQGINVFITIASEAERKYIHKGCHIVEIPYFHSKFNRKAIVSIRKAIKEHHIDVIYAASSAGLSNALFASLGTKAKTAGYRGTQAKIRRTDPTYYLAILNPRVDHVICETEDIKDYLLRFIPGNKLTVNTKPFDINWITDACAHPLTVENIPTDAFKLIYIANTKGRPHKGLSVLIQAMHLLNNPKAHLIFIGNYDEVDRKSAQNGIAGEQIHFLGERSDAISFLPATDLFVLPSTRDASPRTIREAMACSLPCVMSDIPGARELVINGETALTVKPGSPQALADGIRYFIEHEDKRQEYGIAGRNRIINEFTMGKYVDICKQIFCKLN